MGEVRLILQLEYGNWIYRFAFYMQHVPPGTSQFACLLQHVRAETYQLARYMPRSPCYVLGLSTPC